MASLYLRLKRSGDKSVLNYGGRRIHSCTQSTPPRTRLLQAPTAVGRNADDTVVVAPDQAPLALLIDSSTAVLATNASSAVVSTSPVAGKPVRFDASASVAPSSPIATYAWNFGDGNTYERLFTHDESYRRRSRELQGHGHGNLLGGNLYYLGVHGKDNEQEWRAVRGGVPEIHRG